MKMIVNRRRLGGSITLALALSGGMIHAQEKATETQVETMKAMGQLVGGVWRTTGTFKAEFRYEWRIPGKAIHGLGKAAIGTPQEFRMDSMYGFDPAAKKCYYYDFHGPDTIYNGLVTGKGNSFEGEFSGAVGDAGNYRFVETLVDHDTLEGIMLTKNKKGEWVKTHTMHWKRTAE